jgi:hypothetical protein
MLSMERLEAYRRMTPAEKWAVTVELIEGGWRMLLSLPPEELDRRLEIMRREHQAVNDAVVNTLR